MALTKCKECKKEVSNKASKCPHCGIANPGLTAKSMLGGCALLIVGLFIVSALIAAALDGGADDASNASSTSPAPAVAAAPSTSTPAAPTSEPAPAKHFDYTAAEYRKYFNAVMREIDEPARLPAGVQRGAVNDTFKGEINRHAHLVGVVGKDHGKVLSITVIGAGDGTEASGANILLGALGAMAAAFPDVELKTVGQELNRLITDGSRSPDRKATRTFNGAKLTYSQDDVVGVWITAEPI